MRMVVGDRVWIHLSGSVRRVVEPGDVYLLESAGADTWVRFHRRRRLKDVRPLGEVVRVFEPHGFVRIHREYAVNGRRIYEVRKRAQGQDWEVKLEPPVNRVLPVSRGYLSELRAAFGDA